MNTPPSKLSKSWEKAADKAARQFFPQWYVKYTPPDLEGQICWPPPSSVPLDHSQLLNTAMVLRLAYGTDDKDAASKAADEAWKLMNACHDIIESARRLRVDFEEHQKHQQEISMRTIDFKTAVRTIVGDKNDARAKKQFLAYIEAYWGEVDFCRSYDIGYSEPVRFNKRDKWVNELTLFHLQNGFSNPEVKSHSRRLREYMESEILKKISKATSNDNQAKFRDK